MIERNRGHTPRFKMAPVGHILGSSRMALVITPCCNRRMRIHLTNGSGRWSINRFQRCPKCRRLWRAKSKITVNGFLKSVVMELAI